MRRCSVCSKYHKGGSSAHVQRCCVCGGNETTLAQIQDVNPRYACDDKAAHEKIVSGFGDAALVAEAIPPPVTPRKKPSKSQTTWFE